MTRPPADQPKPSRRGRHPVRAVAAGLLAALLVGWGVQLAVLAAGVSTARQYWSHPQGRGGGLLYVALGDSAAQGVGASRPDRGYVGLLAQELRARTRRPVQVVNLSRSGARLRDVLSVQLPALRRQGLRPDLVTLDIGGNDIRGGYDASAFRRDADQLSAALPAGTVLTDVPYFMHGHWERDARRAASVLTASATRHRLVVVPLHAAQRREGWAAMLTQFGPDLFHPNDAGYRLWARTLWPAVAAGRAVSAPVRR